MGRLSAAVEGRLSGVPPDRLLLPLPATIAAPAALHYALLGEGEEVADLREMFENLLVTSMDRNTAADAHPAFVSMISQLTPDEAWILKSIDRSDYALYTLYDIDTSKLLGFRTALGLGAGIDETRRREYISNLVRLGVLQISNEPISNLEEYSLLDKAVEAEFVDRHHNLDCTGGSIQVTPLGGKFLNTCVRVKGHQRG
jgi:hypothetical protein